jgi:hypothetical protein
MMFTARQLVELHKAAGGNGQVVLPYSARLTPMAMDWIKSAKITIGYSDSGAIAPTAEKTAAPAPAASTAAGAFLWWCDGSCGSAKAAISMESKQLALRGIDPPPGSDGLVAAIKTIAVEVKSGKAAGGILVLETAGPAVVLANRCASLRAIVGTSLAAVEQGINLVAANVLVIEHPRLTLAQVRNLLARFLRGKRELSEAARKQIAEMASCA